MLAGLGDKGDSGQRGDPGDRGPRGLVGVFSNIKLLICIHTSYSTYSYVAIAI